MDNFSNFINFPAYEKVYIPRKDKSKRKIKKDEKF